MSLKRCSILLRSLIARYLLKWTGKFNSSTIYLWCFNTSNTLFYVFISRYTKNGPVLFLANCVCNIHVNISQMAHSLGLFLYKGNMQKPRSNTSSKNLLFYLISTFAKTIKYNFKRGLSANIESFFDSISSWWFGFLWSLRFPLSESSFEKYHTARLNR